MSREQIKTPAISTRAAKKATMRIFLCTRCPDGPPIQAVFVTGATLCMQKPTSIQRVIETLVTEQRNTLIIKSIRRRPLHFGAVRDDRQEKQSAAAGQ